MMRVESSYQEDLTSTRLALKFTRMTDRICENFPTGRISQESWEYHGETSV